MKLQGILILALSACTVQAFAPPKYVTPAVEKSVRAPTVLSSIDARESFGELSRKSRRTVYTHDDWVQHRASERFLLNLSSLLSSGVMVNIYKVVFTVTFATALLVGYNCLAGEYQDLNSVTHAGPLSDLLPVLSLPLSPFTLASPSLGLLLVFRTNTSYKRWDEARKNWGMNINHTRDLVRLGTAYYDRSAVSEERCEEDLDRLALNTWAFVRSMKRHLSPEWEDEEAYRLEMLQKLPLDQAEAVFNAAHRPNRALQDLSNAIENLPMHFMRRNEVHGAATIFEDNLGSSERLLTSPVPLFYSRHTARFLYFWFLTLPFGLWGPLGSTWNHIMLVPTMFFLSIFLFGISELATMLEEPFTILPMQGFCDKIYNWVTEIVTFVPGDNGMPVYNYENNVMDGTESIPDSVLMAAMTERGYQVNGAANGATNANYQQYAAPAPPTPVAEPVQQEQYYDDKAAAAVAAIEEQYNAAPTVAAAVEVQAASVEAPPAPAVQPRVIKNVNQDPFGAYYQRQAQAQSETSSTSESSYGSYKGYP